MTPEQATHFKAQLIPLFAQLPIGVADTDIEGNIVQVNPHALQLIMPMAIQQGISGMNLLDVLDAYWPELRALISTRNQFSGRLLDQQPVQLPMIGHPDGETRQFVFTIEKIDEGHLLFFFNDLTTYLRKLNAPRTTQP
ncbi:hypothetical protein J2I47_12885 [Fibrella sp. HMF5335]|uniref:PAS domain-containing protein n=1 Tax=Fibrella rubiginis TaxID=2817060 RepID=A0A939GEE3_9BACT|nr:hypothetical protein [Fibrella rubiginis]MBO0937444.1 hypothetical protein [Fibrella rubiginis]